MAENFKGKDWLHFFFFCFLREEEQKALGKTKQKTILFLIREKKIKVCMPSCDLKDLILIYAEEEGGQQGAGGLDRNQEQVLVNVVSQRRAARKAECVGMPRCKWRRASKQEREGTQGKSAGAPWTCLIMFCTRQPEKAQGLVSKLPLYRAEDPPH